MNDDPVLSPFPHIFIIFSSKNRMPLTKSSITYRFYSYKKISR